MFFACVIAQEKCVETSVAGWQTICVTTILRYHKRKLLQASNWNAITASRKKE